MPDNLKSTMRIFALKYAWHTLGESIVLSSTRKIHTSNKCIVTSINRKKDNLPIFLLSNDEDVDPVDNHSLLEKAKSYRKDSRFKESYIRLAEAKTITESVKFKRNTKSKKLIFERETLTAEIYREYNKIAFDSKLPGDLLISWSRRLTSTAGITKMSCLVTGKVKVHMNRG